MTSILASNRFLDAIVFGPVLALLTILAIKWVRG